MRFFRELFSWQATCSRDRKVHVEQPGVEKPISFRCGLLGDIASQCSCKRSRSCKTIAKPSRSLGQEVAHSSFTTLVSPHTTKSGLNLSQMSTYHSLLFLPGNHRKIYLSKERGSKDFNSSLQQLARGLLPYVAIYQAVWFYKSGSPGILGCCHLTLLYLGMMETSLITRGNTVNCFKHSRSGWSQVTVRDFS